MHSTGTKSASQTPFSAIMSGVCCARLAVSTWRRASFPLRREPTITACSRVAERWTCCRCMGSSPVFLIAVRASSVVPCQRTAGGVGVANVMLTGMVCPCAARIFPFWTVNRCLVSCATTCCTISTVVSSLLANVSSSTQPSASSARLNCSGQCLRAKDIVLLSFVRVSIE